MMRKIGLKRPSKLQLGPKKVAPPLVPGDHRMSGVYSEAGDYREHGQGLDLSFDSVQSEMVMMRGRAESVSDADSSSGYGSQVTMSHETGDWRQQNVRHSMSSFQQRRPSPGHQLGQLGSPAAESGERGFSSRASVTSLDSGWASNNVPPSSLSSLNTLSSPGQEDSGHQLTSFNTRRHSTLSSTAPAPPPVRTSSIRSSSLRGSSESVSSSKCSQSDMVYRPSSRRYSSSSSITSSRPDTDTICTMDIRHMISQGLPELDVVNCWLADLRFEEYFSLFASAGYDMNTISRMTPEDLTAIGIKKPHHRKKLKAEIDKLGLEDWLPRHVPQSVEELMHLLQLTQYTSSLHEQGYNSVKDVLSISIEDLEDVGFFMLGHQKRLLLGIKRIKELRSGKKPSVVEYNPEEVSMSSLPPTLNSKQSFSSFHSIPGRNSQSNILRFPQFPAQPGPADSSDPGATLDMPSPMQPLNNSYYPSLSRSSSTSFSSIHSHPQQLQLQDNPKSIWQRFPSVIHEHHQYDLHQDPHQVQLHQEPHQVQLHQEPHTTGTLTRLDKDLQIFNCEFISGGSGSLPRPTATVKPLTPTLDNNNSDVPVVCDDLCSDLPFANERLGTIRLKTSPGDACAEYERGEVGSKSVVADLETHKSLLRTPTRAPNRSATDVMDDISSMLADLTTELDSMLCSDSVE